VHHSKWFKLIELYVVMVLDSMEDEGTFSNLVFMNTKLCNCLMIHLDLVVQMYAQNFYDYDTFPLYATMRIGKTTKCVMGCMIKFGMDMCY
jgi:hypothetical protein